MAKQRKVEIDEGLIRQMIAGQAPVTANAVREVSSPDDSEVSPPSGTGNEYPTVASPKLKAERPATQEPPSHASVDNRRRRSMPLPDYERTFLIPTDYSDRASLYVSAQTKRKILEIVKKIGNERLTATSFVDNILQHHIATFRDDINRLYRARNQESLV